MSPKHIHPSSRSQHQLRSSKHQRSTPGLYSLGLACLIVGPIVGLAGLLFYHGGMPEHIAQTRVGSRYVSEQPPGMPHYTVLAIAGGIITLAGLLMMAVPKLIKICFRKNTSTIKHP